MQVSQIEAASLGSETHPEGIMFGAGCVVGTSGFIDFEKGAGLNPGVGDRAWFDGTPIANAGTKSYAARGLCLSIEGAERDRMIFYRIEEMPSHYD